MVVACNESRHVSCVWKKIIVSQKLSTCVFIANLQKIIGKINVQLKFHFIDTRNILSAHESVFRPTDSCVHEFIISIVHEIYNAFDANPKLEVRSVFL